MGNLQFTINSAAGGLDFTIDRSSMECAPETVRLTADLSNVTFAQGAGGNPLLDERFRRLDFHWDFNDSGEWANVSQLLPEHRAKRYALGAFVTHVYQSAGTYDITLTVTERSLLTNWVAQFYQVTKGITVGTQDAAYAGAKTVCVNPVGDSDFTGAPAGATQINVDTLTSADTEFTDENGNEPRRFLFKGGETFEVEIFFFSGVQAPHYCFGSYGNGKATLTPPAGEYCFGANVNYRPTELNDLRFDNLIFAGDWNMSSIALDGVDTGIPSTNFPWTNGAISLVTPFDLIVNACEISGMRNSALILQYDDYKDFPGHFVFADTTVTNCGAQYWVFISRHEYEGATGATIGCSIFPQSDQIDGGNARVVAFRENGVQNFHCRSCEFSSMDANNFTTKFCNTPLALDQQKIYTIHWNRFEGSAAPVTMQSNSQVEDRVMEINYIFDGNVIVGDYGTQTAMQLSSTGGAIRNNLFLQPGGLCFDETKALAERSGNHNYGLRSFEQSIQVAEVAAPGQTIPQATLDAGVLAYNNTLINRRTALENSTDNPSNAEGIERRFITNLFDANNIIDGADFSDANSMGPLTTTTIPAPRSLGFKGASTQVLDTDYAPDPADVVKAEPYADSAALSGATGEFIAYRDITGGVRPVGSEDIGCWQMTA